MDNFPVVSLDYGHKSFDYGGNALVRSMDNLLGVSEIIEDLHLKCKGVSLPGILNSLVAGRVNEPRSVKRTVEDLQRYPLVKEEFGLDPDQVTVKNFYRGLETLGKNDQSIYNRIMDEVRKRIGLDLSEMYIDWTTLIVFGRCRELAQRGHSKDHRSDKPQVKVGVAITGRHSIPFFYSVEAGSVPDVTQFKSDYLHLKERLPRGSLVVYDKGGSCKLTEKMIRGNGHHYLTAVKNSQSLRVCYQGLDRKKMKVVHTYKNGQNVSCQIEEKDGVYRYHFYDERRASHALKKRERKLEKLLKERNKQLQAIKKKGVTQAKKKFTKKIHKTLEYGDRIIHSEVTVQKRLYAKTDEQLREDQMAGSELNGFFTLKSSRKLTPQKALRKYRQKDRAEKMFSALKSVHSIRPFRVWTTNEIQGAALVCMLATLFISLIQALHDLTDHTQKTITNQIRKLTLGVKQALDGTLLKLFYNNLTPQLHTILSIPT